MDHFSRCRNVLSVSLYLLCDGAVSAGVDDDDDESDDDDDDDEEEEADEDYVEIEIVEADEVYEVVYL